jgi:hypothetical protein
MPYPVKPLLYCQSLLLDLHSLSHIEQAWSRFQCLGREQITDDRQYTKDKRCILELIDHDGRMSSIGHYSRSLAVFWYLAA